MPLPPLSEDPLQGSPTMQAGSVLFTLGYEDKATPDLKRAESQFDSTSKAFEEAAESVREATEAHETALLDLGKASQKAANDFKTLDKFWSPISKEMFERPIAEPALPEPLLNAMYSRPISEPPKPGPIFDPQAFADLVGSAQLVMEQKPEETKFGASFGTDFWTTFWKSQLKDTSFGESLTEATYEDVQGLIKELRKVVGDEDIGDAFWKQLAESKAGDDVFIKRLATDFFKDEGISTAFFESLGQDEVARKAFVEDIGKELAEATLPAWKMPMEDLMEVVDKKMSGMAKDFTKGVTGEFTDGIKTIRRDILQVFALGSLLVATFRPFIEILQWMVEPLFGPIADAISDMAFSLYEIMPPFTEIMKGLANSVIPPIMVVLKALMPIVDLAAEAFSGLLSLVGPALEGLSAAVTVISDNAFLLWTVLTAVGVTLAPTIIGWTTAVVANTAAMVANAAVTTGAWIAAQWKKVFALEAGIAAWWGGTAAAEANTVAQGVNTTASTFSLAPLVTKVTALWASVAAWTASTAATVANTVALWTNSAAVWASAVASGAWAVAQGVLTTVITGATVAMAAFNAVVLANPITWVVAGVAALAYAVYKIVDVFIGWANAWKVLLDVGAKVLNWVLWPIKFLISAITNVLYYFGEGVMFLVETALYPFKLALDGIKYALDAVGTGIDYVVSGFKSIGEAISFLPEWLLGGKYTLGIDVEQVGKDAMAEMASGIELETPKLEAATGEALTAVSKQLPHSEPKEGPLRGLRQSGAEVMQQLAMGVEEGEVELKGAMESSLTGLRIEPLPAARSAQMDLGETVTQPLIEAIEAFQDELMAFLEESNKKTVDLRHDAAVFARFQV